MNLGNILVILGCLAAGYAIVSVLMKTNADDLRRHRRRTSHRPLCYRVHGATCQRGADPASPACR